MTVYIVLGREGKGPGWILHVFCSRELAEAYGEKHDWQIGFLELYLEEYEVEGEHRQHRCPCET